MLLSQQTLIRLPSVDSTNNYAAKLIASGFSDRNTVILADEQTEGRGQRGKAWQVEANENITLSWICEAPEIHSNKQFYISMAISLALIDLLKAYSISGAIKWPNDLFVEQNKIAGLLIENQLSGSRIKHSIVGIGLNVNQTVFSTDCATSLALIMGKDFDLRSVESKLLKLMEKRWIQLRTQKLDDLKTDYLDHFLLLGKSLPKHPQYIISGVTEEGRLEAKGPDETLTFAHGEIDLYPLLKV